MTAGSLADRVLDRDPRAIARAISLIEEESPAGTALIRRLVSHTGHAYLIGVTGPPGAGKSTLVDRLIGHFRAAGRTVAVVAVDPTSPFTGGAILGDRVRMQAHASDQGVFIRSMATRGHLGGLARATTEAALVLDAARFDVVLIETVGVGQDEVDIVRTADLAVVTMVPGAGDDVQALKAGIMEIADIFVVNKSDREGADRTVASLEGALALQTFGPGQWRPPIVKTEATTGAGVTELVDAIARFREHAGPTRGTRHRDRAEWRLRELMSRRFLAHVEQTVLVPGELDALLDRLASREVDPYTAAEDVLGRAIGGVSWAERAAPASPVFTLHHVGIAVSDLEASLTFYRDAAGLEAEPPEEVPSQQVRAHFLQAGAVALELLEATDAGSPIAAFLRKRGPGLHHVAFAVKDLAATLAHLGAGGVRLIDARPRPGAHGALVAFIHPAAAHGVLVELVQQR